jgi:IS5 family transposase
MPDPTIIPFEPLLPQVLPTIAGNVDYRLLRDQLLRIDELLRRSGLEAQLMQKDLQRWLAQGKNPRPKAQQNRQLHCGRALRCNIARVLLQEDFRGFAARLADSPLLQHFCGVSQLLCITVPSKSTLQRYDQWWPQTEVRQVIQKLLGLAASTPEKLHLSEAVDLESAFLDSTCLCANIHYPVDWVLFRDVTRTLMKAVLLIRDQGLKHRMPAPESFLSRINKLCIQMTHAGKKDDRQRHRKKTLRQMDQVVRTVGDHAKRYRDLLQKHWQQTQWTQAQAQQVLGRMDQVLQQLPQARKQARQRILQGQAVANEEKILSLYEPDIQVIVRKKAGAEVEFGNTLFLAENPQGLILDWELFRETAPADAALLARSVGRMEKLYGPLKAVAADRGFDSEMNRVGLAEDRIYNGVCPRSPQLLHQRNGSWKFKRLQRRRAQTEARVSIIKNVFLGGRARSKGFAHRELTVTWSVLVHNLWVLARLPQTAAAEAARAA